MENPDRLRLLIDTDAYCKLGVAGLLDDAVGIFGASIQECGRLPALPYMLKRGRLRSRLGDGASDRLLELAQMMPPVTQLDKGWLEALINVPAIDPGEAQLIAASAGYGSLLITGDKRALSSIRDIPGLPQTLNRQLVALEPILIELYHQIGSDIISERVQPLMRMDNAVQICFASPCPLSGLLSYFNDLKDEVYPLVLWQPPSIGSI